MSVERDPGVVPGRFFLVGCPRSGTTVLQSALAAHSEIRSFPESHFFAAGDAHRHRWGLASRERPEAAALTKFLADLDAQHLNGIVPRRNPFYRPYCRAFIRILDTLTREAGKSTWLEKTPRHLHHIPMIERAVPQARFIHIVREGQDVVASLYDVTHRHPEQWSGARDITTCMERWNRDLALTLSHQNSPAHHVVRYEAFVEHPERVLQGLCKFMGLPYEEGMIEQRDTSLAGILSEGEEWKRGAGGTVKRAASKFDRVFTAEEQARIRSRLRPIPEGLGVPEIASDR